MVDTAQAELPTWDQALAQGASTMQPETTKLPTWDEAFSQKETQPSALSTTWGAVKAAISPMPFSPTKESVTPANEAFDAFFKNTAGGRIMSAFGHGVGEQLGAIGPEKMPKEFANEQNLLIGGVERGIVMPAASTLANTMRIVSAPFQGIAEAGKQALTEMGAPGVGKELEFDIENAPIGHGIYHSAMEPIAQARSMVVIGEGEKGYFGTKEPTPQEQAARHEATIAATPSIAEEIKTVAEEKKPTPDIHQMARNVAPDTFAEYDRLSSQKDNFRQQLAELAEQRNQDAQSTIPHDEEKIEGIKSKIENLSEEDPIKAGRLQKRLDAWLKENDEHIENIKSADTDEMAALRKQIQDTDYRMRDLSPVVSAAYRVAQEHMPVAEEAKIIPAPTALPAELKPIGFGEKELPAPIVEDVSKKLVGAGRPKEEADAAATLVAAHYQARSERFAGKAGTAEEMYAKDGANIRVGKGKAKARELAQEAKGKIRLATNEAKATITLMKSADASTFIHETGHHWLDELMRDSLHEDAPEDLKNDVEIVRNWLGAEEGQEITTRQHEKFARGFERYMMEGTAPSKALAGVFEKFKRWLISIYQTVNKLRSPITDDIRDVFDRLLSSNPEKTVIAPEHEPGKILADIHEADAEHTPPAEAEAARDRIYDEINKTAKLHEPEIADALDTAKSHRVPTAIADSESVGGAVGPTTRETSSTEKPEAISTSGSKIGSEGNGLSKPEPEPKLAERTNPDATLGKPKSDFVDKAGNIRLDNLATPEDVNAVIRQTATDNGDFLGARRGVISDAQALELADALGMDAAKLNLRKIGQAFNAEQIIAARKLLIQSAVGVRDAMAKAATGSDSDVMAYAEAKARHLMIQEQVSGITAEAGRALRAFRSLEGAEETKALGDFLEQTTGKTLFQLKKEAALGASLDTPQKVSKFIHDSKKPSFGDMILEYWIDGLISGPATHTTYMIGNTLSALWKAIPETGVAALLGKIHGEETIKSGEIGARLRGGAEGLPLALSAAGKALKTGVTTLLPGEEVGKLPFQQGRGEPGVVGNEPITWKQLGSDTFGAIKGLRDAIIAAGELAKTGEAPLFEKVTSPLGAIPDVAIKGIRIPIGTTVRIPARAIAAIHSFFRTANYSMEKAALAYRSGVDAGLSGEDFAAHVAEGIVNPSPEIMKEARGQATELTLMGKGGVLTQYLSKITNVSTNLPLLGETKLLKFIDPFVHISSNIIEQSILQRTPVGLLSSEIRADIAGVNGAAARDMAQARMIVGTALAVTAGGLAAEGLISGSGPSDPKEAAAWKMLGGNQPHSVRIGDTWYDMHRLGPLGMLMGVAADMHDFIHSIGKEDASKVAAMFVHSITQNIMDESFMRGPSELIKAVTDSDRYGDAYVRNLVSSFVPFSVGMSQATRAIDPYSRQTRTVMDAIKAKLPWESQTLFPRRDIWGEPIANKEILGPAGFSAIYETKINKDPVNQAMLKLGIFPPQPMRKIRGVQLTDQQYDDYCRQAGRMAKMRMNAFVNNPGFAQIPDAQKIEFMKNILETSRESARSIVMMQNPDIINKAIENKTKILKGRIPRQ